MIFGKSGFYKKRTCLVNKDFIFTTDVLLKIAIFGFLKPPRLIFTIGGKVNFPEVIILIVNF